MTESIVQLEGLDVASTHLAVEPLHDRGDGSRYTTTPWPAMQRCDRFITSYRSAFDGNPSSSKHANRPHHVDHHVVRAPHMSDEKEMTEEERKKRESKYKNELRNTLIADNTTTGGG